VFLGDLILTESLESEIGERIRLKKVLLLGSKKFTIIGRPLVQKAVVEAVVEEQTKAAKVISFKKKRLHQAPTLQETSEHEGFRHWDDSAQVWRLSSTEPALDDKPTRTEHVLPNSFAVVQVGGRQYRITKGKYRTDHERGDFFLLKNPHFNLCS